jgi:hypothetical protein
LLSDAPSRGINFEAQFQIRGLNHGLSSAFELAKHAHMQGARSQLRMRHAPMPKTELQQLVNHVFWILSITSSRITFSGSEHAWALAL